VTVSDGREGSARRAELVELAYRYVLDHGVNDLSLRPLATAISSSPRVLLYLFGSKDGLLVALLERARADELAALATARSAGPVPASPTARARLVWDWLVAPEHRGLLRLWVECYSRSLTENDGPWSGFARATVADWLDLLRPEPAAPRAADPVGAVDATLLLAVLRGALLDLLATGDESRVSAAVTGYLDRVDPPR
jgi:AcrR family transcriptional regulator